MPLRRVTEAAYERHRQKLAESASPVTAAHAAAATPAPAASSAKVAAAASTAPTPSLRVSAAGAQADSTPALLAHASSTAAQPQAPPTANPVAPTPTLFHFECLRCGFSSKQSSKTVSLTRATRCFGTSESALRYAVAADGFLPRVRKLGMMLQTHRKSTVLRVRPLLTLALTF